MEKYCWGESTSWTENYAGSSGLASPKSAAFHLPRARNATVITFFPPTSVLVFSLPSMSHSSTLCTQCHGNNISTYLCSSLLSPRSVSFHLPRARKATVITFSLTPGNGAVTSNMLITMNRERLVRSEYHGNDMELGDGNNCMQGG